MKKRIVIIGGGFAGINAAKILGNKKDIEVTLIDRKNYHLFQPLLYQVAMSALGEGDIAAPLRNMLANYRNITVFKGIAKHIDAENKVVRTDFGNIPYDYLILACGVKHHYFGNNQWEEHAPGLKTLAQAKEIRRRVLEAYEAAERASDPVERKKLLTFVIVGGGPTGVELAGSIGEMSRYTLSKLYRQIDPKLTRIFIVEAAPRILGSFDPDLASKATRSLEKLGVQVWTSSMVSDVDENGVQIGNERIEAATVLWAAGVTAIETGKETGAETDRIGRIIVEEDLSIPGYPDIFVGGDQANFAHGIQSPLPGLAPVALQQGRAIAKNIILDLKGKPRKPFRYTDKGQMATIGKNKAILQIGSIKFDGAPAWFAWLLVHIYYLASFKHRIFVLMQWGWSYFTFGFGARLIVNRDWRFYPEAVACNPDREKNQS
ncbi:MAG: NAD(P)/FAD-dependent oxidoreductase [Chlorobium sp.]|jgi:NADH dehydrogenase|uniref:NAD(P)/FAD-dependent oxidoreductase n=1 Tax=Chlorobium sp. TaxID=1095 RepID=UPI001D20E6C8|nr:NAD(P)/FAD-dependent oxidoreductase [Chlorobium sp.]MBN1279418.1 NAD(P)/FAD-dependent oxidoreductase [Chlorobiaceae bacterium]MCF8215260.1 NAD(P)/FAD-dependent oxidoreductase [Chlorobium sp.]MCF8270096.1 NAD(P)/FAD-dependent oxidoreductase [Chlorobium sp.]MCF8286466.1 NAD(P)/FAD-dependent oxidoreductase [Chlorobium sp.]MCF8290065.1 NAD(P)/FAD-dependent oxidoreductase [Chlorobium sp.]